MGYFVMYFLLGEFGSLCPLKFVSILSYLVYQHEIIYNIPTNIEALCFKMLEQSREKRFSNMQEILQDIE